MNKFRTIILGVHILAIITPFSLALAQQVEGYPIYFAADQKYHIDIDNTDTCTSWVPTNFVGGETHPLEVYKNCYSNNAAWSRATLHVRTNTQECANTSISVTTSGMQDINITGAFNPTEGNPCNIITGLTITNNFTQLNLTVNPKQ